MQLPKLIAHRGASQIAPENTLIAFEKAHALGATWVEFDVMVMQCGTLIVHHDDTFERILGLKSRVHETPYTAIQNKDAGSWFKSTYSHVRIATLAQTLAHCAQLNLSLNIEFKTDNSFAEQTAQKTLALLRDFSFYTPDNVLLSSATMRALEVAQGLAPAYKCALVADNWTDVNAALASSLKLSALSLHYPLLSAEKMQTLRREFQVLAFTVNEPHLAHTLFERGVCSVFSDDPLLLS